MNRILVGGHSFVIPLSSCTSLLNSILFLWLFPFYFPPLAFPLAIGYYDTILNGGQSPATFLA